MSALLPHDHPTVVPAAVIPAQRTAPPPETPETPDMPERVQPAPAVLPTPRTAAVWSVVSGMAVGAVGTLAAAAIVSAPAVVPAPTVTTPKAPEPRVAFAGTVSVPGRAMTSFGDGTWQVGIDVEPGRYTTTGGPDCRHALKPAATGAAIVKSTVSTGSTSVALTEADGWFETAGCGTWQQAG